MEARFARNLQALAVSFPRLARDLSAYRPDDEFTLHLSSGHEPALSPLSAGSAGSAGSTGEDARERAEKLTAQIQASEHETKVIAVSVMLRTNMNEVRLALLQMVERLEAAEGKTTRFQKVGTDAPQQSFLDTRSVDESMDVQYPGQEQ